MTASKIQPALCAEMLDREFAALADAALPGRAQLHTPVMLWGAPGIGKSQLVQQAASRHGVPIIDIRLSQLEPSDLRGIPFRHDNEVIWAPPAMLPQAQRDGERGILFLDEITSALPTVAAAAYQLILDRRIGEYRLPAGWMIVAAGNRVGDRGVAYAMPAPLANRFVHYELEVRLHDWLTWAQHQNIDQRLMAFLQLRDDLLMGFDPRQEQQAFPSPRSWEFADRALKKYADVPALLAHALAAAVGRAAAQALLEFIQQPIPTVTDLLAGTGHLPHDVASQLLFMAHARHWLSQQQDQQQALTQLVSLLGHFSQPAVAIQLLRDLYQSHGERALTQPAYIDWALKMAPDLIDKADVAALLP